jgi:acyl carrier protein
MRSADEIEHWIIEELSAVLGLSPSEIDADAPFVSFGMSSTDMVTLSGDLEQWLGQSISPTIAWECPTVSALAHHLAEEATGARKAEDSEISERPD